MNVLGILQNACQQIGIPAPTNFTATDTNSLQLYSLFRDVHTYLRNQRIWPQMKSTHEFTLEADRQLYQLPPNFFAALLGTQYDKTTKFPMIGPLSDAQFAMRQYGLAGFTPLPAYRVFGPDNNQYSAGGQFEVWPMPTAPGDTIAFDYQWANIFLPQNWQPSTAYTINTSYVNANGNIYKCTGSGTSSSTTAPSGRSDLPITNGTASFTYIPQAYEAILAPTDLSAFDPEVVIAGFKTWYFEAKVQPQAQACRAQFDKMIDAAKRRFVGSFRGSMSRRYRGTNGVSPQGSWSLE